MEKNKIRLSKLKTIYGDVVEKAIHDYELRSKNSKGETKLPSFDYKLGIKLDIFETLWSIYDVEFDNREEAEVEKVAELFDLPVDWIEANPLLVHTIYRAKNRSAA